MEKERDSHGEERATRKMDIPEYDLHERGMRVDDALVRLDRLIARARAGGPPCFAVITGYGSSGGTSRIKDAVLAACRRYREQCHIRGFLDGDKTGDIFSEAFLAFPAASLLPARHRRSPNPGVVFICV